MTALSYEEALARSRLVEVLGYHVELDVTGGDDVFESVTAVRFGCRAPGADTDAARSSYDDISYAKGAAALRQLVA